MTEENKKRIDMSLVLPIGLILIEVIAVIGLMGFGYEISEFLSAFLIFLGIFLVLQIAQQLLLKQQIKKAATGAKRAVELADSDQPMEAIKAWKDVIFSLPKEKYLDALARMGKIYQAQEMTNAVQKVKDIHAESIALFDMSQNVRRTSQKDRHDFQSRTSKLRQMVQELPEKNTQTISIEKPED